jgi:phage terminase large subunit-like protein
VSNDVDGLQGLDPSLAIVDEIGFQPVESWDSLRMASGKRARSTIIGVGTPGFDRDNALFHVRKAIREGARLPGLHFREYAAPDGCDTGDRKAWRHANPAIRAGFLRETALETDIGITPEGHFRLFRLGQHVEGVDSWLGANGRAIWDALAQPWDFVAGDPTWIGVDVGLKRDSTAVVAVQRDPEGMLHTTARFWVPSSDEPVDVTDVMEHLRELARAYQVEAISYDPRFFDVPAKMLADEGLPLVEIPQSVERMTSVLGSLLELIKRGELRHDGADLFATQVLNAVPRFNERGFTLQKSKSRGRIDGAIALGLAVDRALREAPAPEVMIAWA